MAATTTLLDNLKSDLGTEVNDYDAATTGDDSRRLIKNFDSILDLIQKQRVKASVRADAMIKPGNQSEPLPHPIDTVTALEYTPLEFLSSQTFFPRDRNLRILYRRTRQSLQILYLLKNYSKEGQISLGHFDSSIQLEN